jgi:hypothetical protein
MADKKISQLSAATTPLAGTEVLPIVQGGSTVKVSAADVTTGRAVSAASLTLTGSPLGTASGGTGLASFTANGVPYASSSSVLTTGTALSFNGTTFGVVTGASSSVDYTGLKLVNGGENGTNIDFDNAFGPLGRIKVTKKGGGNQADDGKMVISLAANSVLGDVISVSETGDISALTGNLVVGTAGKGLADSAGNLKLAVNTTSVAAQSVLSGGLTHRKGAYTPGATTPSAVGVSYFDISNSSATSITNFTGAAEGQMLLLVFRDANTTITRNNAYLAGGADFISAANATLLLISDGTNWYEVCRSTTNG